jgi:hypothetical protein
MPMCLACDVSISARRDEYHLNVQDLFYFHTTLEDDHQDS